MKNKNEFYFWEEMWNKEEKETTMNEKEIESILYKCHAENIAKEVMEMAIEMQQTNPKISKLESYERSYAKVKTKNIDET
tara:strand:+ start:312 stop:551 length:240 start_codon:yes stop_codon:yes gene_type:complete